MLHKTVARSLAQPSAEAASDAIDQMIDHALSLLSGAHGHQRVMLMNVTTTTLMPNWLAVTVLGEIEGAGPGANQ